MAGATPVPNAGSGISIVVPTHGRVALVGRLLDSLAAATAGLDGAAEVIVVDSSTGVDAAAIRESCRAAGARYEVGDTSVRRKRNRGIELAEQPIVLFIDSDCAATPTLISEHLRGYDDPRVAGVAGVTRFTGRDSWLWRVIERTSFLDSFSFAARERSLPWAPTCNVSYRREVLRAVDGFHTAFPFRLGADDVDLGLRVTAAGHLIRGNPAAVVEHARETWSGVGLMAWRAFRWGRMHVHLHARHPERVFADFPRWPVLFLLVGIVAMAVAVLRQRPAFLLAPLAWGALALAFEALLAPPVLGARWRDVPLELAARLLGLVYEAGTTVEALRLGRFPVLVREVSYTPPSLRGRNRRIAQVWGAVLALLALLAAGWLACA
ncbi:MAG: glycosyltransferase family 2 protein [Longimicrobiaceae bacterium]